MFATRVCTQRHSFATARLIAKLKPPLCSAESKLPIGVKTPFSTKCGEWVIYAEPVTYIHQKYCMLDDKKCTVPSLLIGSPELAFWVLLKEECNSC